MKTIDFTHAGGFPLTQEQLDLLQQSYTEALKGVAALVVDDPCIISGMELTIVDEVHFVLTAGWMRYNGELLYCAGGTIEDGDLGPAVLGFNVVTDLTSLVYYDGSVFNADINKYLVWHAVAIGAPNTIEYTNVKRYGRQRAYATLVLSHATGTVSGTLNYKKDYVTNRLDYKLALTSTVPSAFGDLSAGTQLLVGTIPDDGCRPTGVQHFLVPVTDEDGFFVKLTGGAYLSAIRVTIEPNGQVFVNFVKPDVSVSLISVDGDGVLSLD